MLRWDTYRSNPRSTCQGGFTLLELMVVLALLGVVTALAMPNLNRLLTSAQATSERDFVLNQISALGRAARLAERDLVVVGSPAADGSVDVPEGTEPHQLDVPPDWQVAFSPPLRIRANGVCLGAELTLEFQNQQVLRGRLEPPFCALEN